MRVHDGDKSPYYEPMSSETQTRIVSVGEKIKDMAELAAVYLIDLRISALTARNRSKLPVLNIEYLGPEAASRSELPGLVLRMLTLWTSISFASHIDPSG